MRGAAGSSGDGSPAGGWQIEFDNEEAEEARVMKMSPPVVKPSAEEVRQHRLTRCPFRSWCSECVAGAANDHSHPGRTEALGEVPEFHCDYAFLRDKAGEKSQPMLSSEDVHEDAPEDVQGGTLT